jgi:glutamate-ammonia-ligase adenylyltransferase
MDRSWIRRKAFASLNPPRVEPALREMAERWPNDGLSLVEAIEAFPLGEQALLHLLAMSEICARRMANDSQLFLWLCQPQISKNERDYGAMLNHLRVSAADSVATNNFQALRRWKNWEMTRIALRELADVAALEQTTAELSQIAEICLRSVFEHWNGALRESSGAPSAEFAVLGLGKLGGAELNYSSDVDLIFLYSEEGQLSPRFSYHEWFNRLAEKILETFSAPNPEGSLFRIDLRLRPEGSAGPLARSLASMENYYAGFGETWERLALIKARGVCGNRELIYEFLQHHQSFIYPSSPTPDLLDEIANIKRRIEREVGDADELEFNVKLGRGGIREIEFVVQVLQLIHGSHHAFLQETSTIKALGALARLELIPRTEVVDLDRAYRFLRRIEHRLQIEGEQQTHSLPRDAEARRRLALSLGYATAQKFIAALNETKQRVRSIFERVITTTPAEAALPDLRMFNDEKAATKALNDLVKPKPTTHIAARTRQVFAKLRPLLLTWLNRAADPDTTLNQFVRFVEAFGLRSLLFELLVKNPKLLELLVKTFDASRFAGDLLIRRPQLLEDITRDPVFYRHRTVADNLERLQSLGATPTNLDPVRAYRQRQLLRIVLRDVVGLADQQTVFQELSDLAEACLAFVNDLLGANDLTIIAMGKFGGGEINYGADLDVLFVGEDVRAAQNLIVAMGQQSAEGNIAVLDARLRPDGEKGPLICSLATYKAYYEQRAQLWEIQALTRARAIIGALQQAFIDLATNVWRETGQRPDLNQTIDGMTQRIRRERGTGSDFLDFKTGEGGMIEAEFLVQALQMRHQIWNPNWQSALTVLRDRRIISAEDFGKAERSYKLLRTCETGLRRFENRSVSSLPVDANEQERLAKRIGYENFDRFGQEYVDARKIIHELYDRYMNGAR